MPDGAALEDDSEAIPDATTGSVSDTIRISAPTINDAAEIHALIAACPPLDTNSLYANLLQTAHFSESCAVARINGKMVGWVSGHLPPAKKETFFLWQVAVHPEARGQSLPRRMLADILSRPSQSHIRFIETSITQDNEASWGLFRSIARRLQSPLRETPWFDRHKHLAGKHDTEYLVTIGPFEAGRRPL